MQHAEIIDFPSLFTCICVSTWATNGVKDGHRPRCRTDTIINFYGPISRKMLFVTKRCRK